MTIYSIISFIIYNYINIYIYIYKLKINELLICEFRVSINSWDLKILHRDLKSWKKRVEKKWNGMEWFVGLKSWMVWNNMEWNGMSGMICPNTM